jgi:hypothetical protein
MRRNRRRNVSPPQYKLTDWACVCQINAAPGGVPGAGSTVLSREARSDGGDELEGDAIPDVGGIRVHEGRALVVGGPMQFMRCSVV